MTTNNGASSTPVPERFYEYALAYLEAAQLLNDHAIKRGKAQSWASSTAVLFNACHAVELFLKAMIMRATPAMKAQMATHSIEKLADKYRELYSHQELNWNFPFERLIPEIIGEDGLPVPFTSEELEQLKKLKAGMRPFSIEHRYPVDKFGGEWPTLNGYEPVSFARTLEILEGNFEQAWSRG